MCALGSSGLLPICAKWGKLQSAGRWGGSPRAEAATTVSPPPRPYSAPAFQLGQAVEMGTSPSTRTLSGVASYSTQPRGGEGRKSNFWLSKRGFAMATFWHLPPPPPGPQLGFGTPSCVGN